MSRLLDPKKDGKYPFEYRNSASTDVRATLEKARQRQKEEAESRLRNVIQRNFDKYVLS